MCQRVADGPSTILTLQYDRNMRETVSSAKWLGGCPWACQLPLNDMVFSEVSSPIIPSPSRLFNAKVSDVKPDLHWTVSFKFSDTLSTCSARTAECTQAVSMLLCARPCSASASGTGLGDPRFHHVCQVQDHLRLYRTISRTTHIAKYKMGFLRHTDTLSLQPNLGLRLLSVVIQCFRQLILVVKYNLHGAGQCTAQAHDSSVLLICLTCILLLLI